MSPTPNALITGVGRRRGLGAAIAAALANDGWDLALSFWHPYDDRTGLERSEDDLEQLADEIGELGRSVALLPADLERPEQPDKLLRAATDAVGPLTGLVLWGQLTSSPTADCSPTS
jgi:3-oxoacyl-[acyl-carrier protein] reductase